MKRPGGSLAALAAVAKNAGLRRLQLAWLGANVGHGAYFVAISVYAFERGGAAGVGVAAVVRMLPAALLTPFAADLADRHSRQRVMLLSDVCRGLALALAALAVGMEASLPLVVVLVTLAGLAYTPFEPAKAALMPALARTPEELAAANVASSGIESVTLFLGPALAGAAVALGGPAAALWLAVLFQFWSAWFVARVPRDSPGEREAPEAAGEQGGVKAGLRAVRDDRRLAWILGLVGAQAFAFGAFSVLVVVLAVDVLAIGDSGVGYLNAALGIGAFVGGAAALSLVSGRFLGRGLGLGVALWGAPLALAGLTGNETVALVLLAIVGLANTLVDVSYVTLVQRIAPGRMLARVFGLLETLMLVTIALGNLAVPLLIDLGGNELAFLVCGGFLPLLAAIALPALARIDASAPASGPDLELLRGVPLFAPLGAVTLEDLAGHAERVRFAGGEAMVTQGKQGERFYVIAAGKAEVTVDGKRVGDLGPGGHFGEIALLREVPRTATVAALDAVEALALDREDFVSAVAGHPQSSAAAEGVIGIRLARARPR